MLYRHTKRFQAVLQLALRVARRQHGYEHGRFLAEAGMINIPHDTLDRFSRAKISHFLRDESGHPDAEDPEVELLANKFLRANIARALWKVCETKGYIDKALRDANIQKRNMYSTREAANALHCLLDAHESRQKEFSSKGLSGSFILYKRSFAYPEHVVKSRVVIELKFGEYFAFLDAQRGTGTYQPAKDEEYSFGFGIIKTKRFWVFTRESRGEQPRVFCFFEQIEERQKGKSKLLGYYGHLMEGAADRVDNFLAVPVLLVSQEFDKKLWQADNLEMTYKEEEHYDVFPCGIEKGSSGALWPDAAHQLPKKILRYLADGSRL